MISRQIVYLDVVFTINWLLDYLLLWATAKFGQLSSTWWRLVLGATLGASYALLPFSSGGGVALDVGGKLTVSLLMVWVAYGGLHWRTYLQAVGYFYLVAFAMAGAMLGAVYFFSGRLDAYGLLNGLVKFLSFIPYPWLLAAAGAAFALARWGAPLLRRSFLNSFFRVPIVICFGAHKLAVRALVDTGNELRDPLTQKPVIIVEYEVLRGLLPPAIRKSIEADEPDLARLVEDLKGTLWATRIRLVPFASLGRHHGMLLCFRPDEIVVVTNDRMVRVSNILVGIYRQKLSPQGTYRALLHPDILQAAIS